MANNKHLKILEQGVGSWNAWREQPQESKTIPDLCEASLDEKELEGVNFSGADLSEVHLHRAKLRKANLSEAIMRRADCREADLRDAKMNNARLNLADLRGAYLDRAHLNGANLHGAKLAGAYLIETELNGAVMNGADLSSSHLYNTKLEGADLSEAKLKNAYLEDVNFYKAKLVETNLVDATLKNVNLTSCEIFGVSTWGLKLSGVNQIHDLVLSKENDPLVTTDYIELAQFIHLILENEKLRDVLNAVTSKLVLILGRFTDDRKAILDKLREELRPSNYIPILFDFEKPKSRDLIETVTTLASMARFIVADITDPACVRTELQTIVPAFPSIPVQPLLQVSQSIYSEFEHIKRFPSVLPICRYDDPDDLLASLAEKIIAPAEAKAIELQQR